MWSHSLLQLACADTWRFHNNTNILPQYIVLKIKKFKCDIQIFAPPLYKERACSPFFPSFQHHTEFCSLALTDTNKRRHRNQISSMHDNLQVLFHTRDQVWSPSWREKITCCTDLSWLFLTTSLWGRKKKIPFSSNRRQGREHRWHFSRQ